MNSQYNSMYDNRAIIETIGTERPYEVNVILTFSALVFARSRAMAGEKVVETWLNKIEEVCPGIVVADLDPQPTDTWDGEDDWKEAAYDR